MIRLMEMESILILVEQLTKVNGSKTNKMELELKNGLMDKSMKDSTKKE